MTTRRRRGQAFVEGAVAAFILVLLIFGSLDFSGAYWRCQGMQRAAVAGAEYAAIRGSGTPTTAVGPAANDSAVKAYVKTEVPGFDQTKVTVESEWLDGDNQPGSRVKVTTAHPLPVTITRMFFPSGCGAPALECRGAAVRRILRH